MTTAAPSTVEELQDILGDQAKFDQRIKSPEDMRNFTKEYLAASAKNSKDTLADLQAQIQIGIVDFMKDNGKDGGLAPLDLTNGRQAKSADAKTRVIENHGQRLRVPDTEYSNRAPGAKVDEVFENSFELFHAILAASVTGSGFKDRSELIQKLERNTEIMNSFGSTVPQDGGFLIPETMRAELLQVALETAVVRPRARVIPMDSLRVPIPAVDSTTNNGSIFGGIIAYWTEEGATLTESQAAFQRIVLDTKKLTAYAAIPNELIADASAFMGFFDPLFPQALAWYEDVAFFNGTGVGEPLGFMNAPAIIANATESGQATKTVLWENVVKMYSRMLPSSLNNAVWIVAPDVFPELATMALSVGTGGSAVWLNNGVSGPPATILGRPVIISEKAKTLGTQGDISFVDLSYYLIGDRQAMQAMQSEHYLFGNDKTAFRIIERLDGRPWLQSAITPQNNSSNTLSPFVQLAAR